MTVATSTSDCWSFGLLISELVTGARVPRDWNHELGTPFGDDSGFRLLELLPVVHDCLIVPNRKRAASSKLSTFFRKLLSVASQGVQLSDDILAKMLAHTPRTTST